MKAAWSALLLAAGLCAAAPARPAEMPATPAQADPVPATDVGAANGSLSDKLSNTNGVIHPQGTVDPGMQKQAPAGGTMPVIPPPGSPGGPTDVQPK